MRSDPRGESVTTSHSHKPTGENRFGLLSVAAGIATACLFYGAIYLIPWPPLERYFLGHPVAIAATVLFWIAAAILLGESIVSLEWDRLETTRRRRFITTPTRHLAGGSLEARDHDAGYVARQWKNTIEGLPRSTRAALGSTFGRIVDASVAAWIDEAPRR